MTINFVNPFKSRTTKTFDKNKISRGMRTGERFSSADVNLNSGKVIFEFGTTTTFMDHLSKPKPLEHVEAVQSSFLGMHADIQVEKQKRIISKVKVAKNNIAKLFKPAGRVSEAVTCIDYSTIPGVGHSTPDHHSSTLTSQSILLHAEPNVRMVPAYASLEAVASPIAYVEGVKGHIEDLTSTVCSPSSQAVQPFTKLEFQLEGLPAAFFLTGLHTIEEEDGNTEVDVKVESLEQGELAISGSFISQSDSDSGFTIYFSSFATSVDASTPEDNHQSLFGVLRRLRRVPKYEDLRNSQIVANRSSPCPDISRGSSDCHSSCGESSGINAAPLLRSTECDNLKKSFLPVEPRICVHQMNTFKKPPVRMRGLAGDITNSPAKSRSCPHPEHQTDPRRRLAQLAAANYSFIVRLAYKCTFSNQRHIDSRRRHRL
ncbi:hypothetical protein JVT61DRAFT_6495 [Boletus reticuloceps]|uniref:Uncharacterized protein n=1 Tax=Boletus reticuloceps TaxID=495285 RepID=A0A8I2YK42_9AGAM|nr:hypothetical protein JVT61DRAFT_6495 [Boletus reticuloceps]